MDMESRKKKKKKLTHRIIVEKNCSNGNHLLRRHSRKFLEVFLNTIKKRERGVRVHLFKNLSVLKT